MWTCLGLAVVSGSARQCTDRNPLDFRVWELDGDIVEREHSVEGLGDGLTLD